MQATAHAPLVQVARWVAEPAAQLVQLEPHADATWGPTQLPGAEPQNVLPLAQVVPQVVPSQVGIDPGTPSAQRVHVAPQAVTSVDEAHWPLQGLKPDAQVKAHALFRQTGAPPSGAEQTLHDGPHADAVVSGTHAPPQKLNPIAQLIPQVPWVQVGVPFVVLAQATQLVPQLVGASSGRHCIPQRWKPAPQTKSQLRVIPASLVRLTQVPVPFVGGTQGEHRPPQDSGAVSGTHWSPQR